jgi:formamidase
MSARGGLNKTPNGVVIGVVQLRLPVVAPPDRFDRAAE